MRLNIYTMIFFLLFSTVANAQTINVKGKITDETGQGVPGVNVVVKGQSVGTISDFDGRYQLEIPSAESILAFSAIGYISQEVAVGTQTVIDIVLREDVKLLDEIIVVGYGSAAKSDLTGAISSIKAEDFKEQPTSSIDQALQGKLSGVNVMQNSGAPGGGISIQIRGATSLSGNSEPLYVIDGVPVSGNDNNDSVNFSEFGGGSGQTKVSALSSINMADITNIEVLKDASAAAIYGARAANGVVLITTKRGAKGSSKITYEFSTGLQQVHKRIPVLKLSDYAKYINDIGEVAGLNKVLNFSKPELLGAGTNWQDEIFSIAPMQSHVLGLSAGTDKTTVYSSLGYFDQDGVLVGSKFNRLSFRLNIDHKMNAWAKFGNTLTIGRTNQDITLNDSRDGIITSALRQPPSIPVRNADGTYAGRTTDGLGNGDARNPVAWALLRKTTLQKTKLNGNFYLSITPIEGLDFRNEFGYDLNFSKSGFFQPSYEFGIDKNDQAVSFSGRNNSQYWVIKNLLLYNKDFGHHKFKFLLAHEAQQSKWENISGTVRDFLSNDIKALSTGDASTSIAKESYGTWAMQSYFARINYKFKEPYLLTATVRRDGSSNFKPGNQWVTTPSISGAVVVSELPFYSIGLKNILNFAKLRVGYGLIGNQNIAGYAFGTAVNTHISNFGVATALNNIPNPNVKWETVQSIDIGVELGFFNDRLRLDVDLYEKRSSDFLISRPSAAVYGSIPTDAYLGLRSPVINSGEIVNRGIDLKLSTANLSKGDLKWTTDIIFSMYKNELVSLPKNATAIIGGTDFSLQSITKTDVGGPVGRFYGHVVQGIYQTENEINEHLYGTKDIAAKPGDIKFKDIDNNGIIDANDRTYIGNAQPDFTYSMTNKLNYKAWDLTLFLTGSQGNDLFNNTRRYTEGMIFPSTNQSTRVLERWTPDNTDTNIPRLDPKNDNTNARVSDRFIEDGSYLRIQTITLGYRVPSNLLEKTKIVRSARAYFNVQNLYTFTNYSGYDPVIGAYSQNALVVGVDTGRYPVPTTYTLGLNIEF